MTAPWHWKEELGDEEMPVLLDHDDNIVCHFGCSTQYYPSEGEPPDEPAAALIQEAPELEWLVRDLWRRLGEDQAETCRCLGAVSGGENGRALPHCGNCRAREAIARLDRARIAGAAATKVRLYEEQQRPWRAGWQAYGRRLAEERRPAGYSPPSYRFAWAAHWPLQNVRYMDNI